ncbi:hypothetical protein ABZ214_07365 [Streptomyces iakyrus]|uniref:hypothetical protein n=1 Tax=Streptomyces iakyrus TaxID=68219 RepID=UPI0033B7A8DE
MARDAVLAKIFVEIADSLVEDFDVIDLLHRLSALRRAARRVGRRPGSCSRTRTASRR